MRGGLFSAGLGRAGKGINPQGGAKVKSAGRAGVKKRVNGLIHKILQKCIKKNITLHFIILIREGVREKNPEKVWSFVQKI